jgi:hypothetical protein
LILDLPDLHKWIYIIVQSAIPLNHPIHLHGHDFLILGARSGTYSHQELNMFNHPRHDTANMPAAGWLAIAFETDNPGAWLMHCHIGWHTSMGFALQILEGRSKIKDTVKDVCALYGTCANWNKWVAERGFKQYDTGAQGLNRSMARSNQPRRSLLLLHMISCYTYTVTPSIYPLAIL